MDNVEKIRGVGLKATAARVNVLDALQGTARPMSVGEVMQSLELVPDPATVYRTLKSLVATGLVKEILIKKGVVSYEAAELPHHHHVICQECGVVEDVELKCEDMKVKPKNFSGAIQHSLEYYGTCDNCAK